VLALINRARSAAGLPALTVTSGLEASSSAHNLRMAGGCGLSHYRDSSETVWLTQDFSN
jgi:uncharacterized protein YkwD